MKVEYIENKVFPVQIDFGDRLRSLSKKASIELEEKLATVNLKIRLEDKE